MLKEYGAGAGNSLNTFILGSVNPSEILTENPSLSNISILAETYIDCRISLGECSESPRKDFTTLETVPMPSASNLISSSIP